MLDKIQKKARGMENAADLDFVGKKEDFMNNIYFKEMKPYDFFDRIPKGKAASGSGFEKMVPTKTLGLSFDGKLAGSMNFGQAKAGMNKSYFGVKTATNNISNTKNKINMFMSGPQKTSGNRNLIQKQYNMFGAKTNIAHNRLAHYLPQSVKSGKPRVNPGNLKFGFGVSSHMLSSDKKSKNFQFLSMGAGPDAREKAVDKVRLFTSGIGNNFLGTADANWTSKFGLSTGGKFGLGETPVKSGDPAWMSKFGLSQTGKNWQFALNRSSGENWKKALLTDRFSKNDEIPEAPIPEEETPEPPIPSVEDSTSEETTGTNFEEKINEETPKGTFGEFETYSSTGEDTPNPENIKVKESPEFDRSKFKRKTVGGYGTYTSGDEPEKAKTIPVKERNDEFEYKKKSAVGKFIKNTATPALKSAGTALYETFIQKPTTSANLSEEYNKVLMDAYKKASSNPDLNINPDLFPEGAERIAAQTKKTAAEDKRLASLTVLTTHVTKQEENKTAIGKTAAEKGGSPKERAETLKKMSDLEERFSSQRSTNKLLKPLVYGGGDMRFGLGMGAPGSGFESNQMKASMLTGKSSGRGLMMSTMDVNRAPFESKAGMLGNVGGKWGMIPGQANQNPFVNPMPNKMQPYSAPQVTPQSPMPMGGNYQDRMPSKEQLEQGTGGQGLQISPASGRAVTYIRGRYKKDKHQQQSSQQNV